MDELKQAITLIRSGEKEQGGHILARLLHVQPKNELAWLWMSQAVKTRPQQQHCLEQVLVINPGNTTARKALLKLKPPPSTPAIPYLDPFTDPLNDPFPFQKNSHARPQQTQATTSTKTTVPNPAKKPAPMTASEIGRILMVSGGIILIVVIIIAAGVFIRQQQQYHENFTPLADVCRGERISAAPRYAKNSSIHPAVGVTRRANGWQLNNNYIPRQARAQTVAETQLVLCMGKVEDIFIESCPYTDANNPRGPIIGRIERYYYKQEARLIEANTGRVVSTQTFTGKSARLCKDRESIPRDGRAVTLKGTSIPEDEVYRWVRSQLIKG